MPRAVGEVSCAFLWCPARSICRRRRHARNPFDCTRCGGQVRFDVDEDALADRGEGQQGSAPSAPRLLADDASLDGDQSPTATRVTLRPHDPATGEEIDKREVVKGYEYARGEFVAFTAEELKAFDVESSKVIDLEKFVPRDDLDPIYFDSSYYLYPDGSRLRVIGAAMAGRSRRARAPHPQPARADGSW
jgi:Ku70/Ku80 beta-barrel domain